MISLGFLFFGGGFVATLLKSLGKLLSTDWDQEKFSAASVLNLFKWPLIFFVLMCLFIAFGIPYLEQMEGWYSSIISSDWSNFMMLTGILVAVLSWWLMIRVLLSSYFELLLPITDHSNQALVWLYRHTACCRPNWRKHSICNFRPATLPQGFICGTLISLLWIESRNQTKFRKAQWTDSPFIRQAQKSTDQSHRKSNSRSPFHCVSHVRTTVVDEPCYAWWINRLSLDYIQSIVQSCYTYSL